MAITHSKKKRVSKKLKSSWRKHVNITDVEDFLEEKRQDERLGPSLDSVPNDAIFRVDLGPSNELVSSKKRRKLAALKPLKCFSALQPYTKVPDPISKRNRVRSQEERASELSKKKKIQRLAKRAIKIPNDKHIKKDLPKRGAVDSGIWENEKDVPSDDWVEKNTKMHNLSGVQTKKRVESTEKRLSAIVLPHPGMSYNPSYEDHQDLLGKVAEKEQKLIKEEKHLDRVTRGMFSKVTAEKRDDNWLVDMSEGLPSKNNNPGEEELSTDDEYKSVNPPVKNVKKSLKQKRKKKEHLKLERARKSLKLQKKKITDIHNIKDLVKHVDKLEETQSLQREISKKNKELVKDKTKVLNAIKYEEPDLEFNLGQEITGNLKDIKTEGNLLTDRFKSMQKRNILAPTKRITFKKVKVKKYTKPGHKDEDWKKTIARSLK